MTINILSFTHISSLCDSIKMSGGKEPSIDCQQDRGGGGRVVYLTWPGRVNSRARPAPLRTAAALIRTVAYPRAKLRPSPTASGREKPGKWPTEALTFLLPYPPLKARRFECRMFGR